MKKKVETIQQYFNYLYWIVEQLFESQHTKLVTGVGYNFSLYQMKTKYRISNIFILLEKIFEMQNSKEIFIYLKRKKKVLRKKILKKRVTKEIYIVDFEKKEYTKKFVQEILWDHCDDILDQMKNNILNFQELQYFFEQNMDETIYEDYRPMFIYKTHEKCGGHVVIERKFYKEKPITQRLKKKKVKKNVCDKK